MLEPAQVRPFLEEKVMENVSIYGPAVIVKTGVGSGELLAKLAAETDAEIVVVEPCIDTIRAFVDKYSGASYSSIYWINGVFEKIPVDYYKADMIILTDYLSFIESGEAIDEMRRVLQFDGILIAASPLLSGDDEDGIYDEYMRSMFPIHNEYYFPEELQTILELNDFKLVNYDVESFKENAAEKIAFFAELTPEIKKTAEAFVSENKDRLASSCSFAGGELSVPYYAGVFRRLKPDTAKGLK